MRRHHRIYDPDIEYKISINDFFAFNRKYGALRGSTLWFFNTLMRAIALPSLLITRYGFGRGAISILTILVSFLYSNYFVFADIPLKSLSLYPNSNELPPLMAALYWYPTQFFQNVASIKDAVTLNWQQEDVRSIVSFYFSFAVLLLGLFNFLYEQTVSDSKKPHIGHRGISFLSLWISHNSKKMDWAVFQRFVEPILVSLIGVILIYFQIEINFGWLLLVSSVALFFEEQRFFARERRFKDPTRR